MPTKIWLNKVKYPIAPEKIEMKIDSNNKTISLIDGGELNLLKSPKLTEITFAIRLPLWNYPFADFGKTNKYRSPSVFLEKLEKLKIRKKKFKFIITRRMPGRKLWDNSMWVALENYTVIEDANDGGDITVDVKLIQHKTIATKFVVIKKKKDDKKSKTKTTGVEYSSDRQTDKEIPDSVTAKEGESLYAICRRELGNGETYKEIARMNNINNPYSLKAGRVVRFG
jgi:nucleoid-associated protein YgaU